MPSPAAELEATEFGTAADRAIASLPERRRDVFILAHLHGLSYREVAESLGITPRTVANHMSLALAQLRDSLAVFTRPAAETVREIPLARPADTARDAGATARPARTIALRPPSRSASTTAGVNASINPTPVRERDGP